MTVSAEPGAAGLARFVPRVLSEWDLEAPDRRVREIESTLVFVDISGFTALSERLARLGRIGTEHLTDILNRVFGSMLDLAYARGGSLLKFGGDALLLQFADDDHAAQAVSAAIEMRSALRDATATPTVAGRIRLRMSVGVHTGPVHLFRVGEHHHELLVSGPVATTTAELEAEAEAGEIMVGPTTAARLPARALGAARGPGRLVRARRALVAPTAAQARVDVPGAVLDRCLAPALRDHVRGGDAEFEHRLATIGFVKFLGTDAVLAEEGADATADALHVLATSIQHAAIDEGVTLLATDLDANGGKFILSAGVPSALGDDEGRMLRAVRRILDEPSAFERKVGVNRGHVFAGVVGATHRATYTVMGDTVNLAARLMAAAPKGRIYATPAVVDRSRTAFGLTPVAPFHVKGKSQPVRALEVGEVAGVRDREESSALAFVGRVGERVRLIEALERPLPAIVVSGDAGSGKTRLVREVLDADRPASITVAGTIAGQRVPYAALAVALRPVLGDDDAALRATLERITDALPHRTAPLLPLVGDVFGVDLLPTPESEALDPRFRPERLGDVLGDVLDVVLRPAPLILVEDAQWLDPASRGMLRLLAADAARRGWTFLVVTREQPCDWIAAPETIALGPLDADEQRAAVVAAFSDIPLRPQEIDELVARAGGNARFLEELVRSTREHGVGAELPESLEAGVADEIDALSPAGRMVLRAAAVLGQRFDPTVLRQVLAHEGFELDPIAVAELDRFIESDRREARFRHEVLRDVAYRGLSYRRRKALHLAAADVLERAATDPARVAAALAGHGAAAGDHARAWRYGRLAAEQAQRRAANAEAAGFYRQALDAAVRLDVPADERAATWIRLGDVCEQAGELEHALTAYNHAVRELADPVARAQALVRSARARERAGAFTVALRDLTRAERLLAGDLGPAAERTHVAIRTLRAIVREGQEQPRLAARLATEAAAEAERVGDDRELAKALAVLEWAHVAMGRPERADQAGRIVQIYRDLGEPERAAGALGNAGAVRFWLGDWDEALRCYREAERAYVRAGDVVNAAIQQANIGELLVCRNDHDGAEPAIADAVRTLRAVGAIDAALFAEVQHGRLLRGRGRHAEAIAVLDGVRTEALGHHLNGTALEAALRMAECRLDQGESELALTLLEEAAAGVPPDEHPLGAAIALLQSLAHASRGDLDEAVRAARTGIDAARDAGMLYELGLLLVVVADLTVATDEPGAAAAATEGRALLDTLGIGRIELSDAVR